MAHVYSLRYLKRYIYIYIDDYLLSHLDFF